jgi:hypothetical protein
MVKYVIHWISVAVIAAVITFIALVGSTGKAN